MDTEHPWRQMVLLLVMASVAVWSEMPDWQRDHVRMKVKTRVRRLVGWAARRAGHRAMTHELAGREAEAQAAYSLAEHLSEIRDRM